MKRSSKSANRCIDKAPEDDTGHESSASPSQNFGSAPLSGGPRLRNVAKASEGTPGRWGTIAKVALSRLLEMPLDIIFEIFGYLHPHDLLRMTRVNWMLRETLMNRSSAFLWRRTLANLSDVPPFPDGMNEPQWVDLLFEKRCYRYSAAMHTRPTSSWCGSHERCTARAVSRKRRCGLADHLRTLFILILHSFVMYRNIPAAAELLKYYVTSAEELATIVPYHPARDSLLGKTWLTFWICIAHAELLSTGASGYLFSVEVIMYYAMELEDLDIDSDTIKEWMSVKQDRFKKLQELHRQPGRTYTHHELVLRPAKLTDEGMYTPQSRVSEVDPQSTEWSEIREPLIAFMQNARAERLQRVETQVVEARHRLLTEVYSDFRLSRPFREILPGPFELLQADAVRQVLYETALDRQLTARMIMDAFEKIPQSFFDNWRARCDEKLLDLVQNFFQAIDDTNTTGTEDTAARHLGALELASTVFWDSKDTRDLTYPAVLVCPTLTQTMDGRQKYMWHTSRLRLAGGTDLATRMIELIRGDPRTMTVEQMDNLDPWFYFEGEDTDGRRTGYSWRCVVSHTAFVGQFPERMQKLRSCGSKNSSIARKRFAATKCHLKFTGKDSLCAYCDARFSNSQALYNHIHHM
ncbi:hypothetical protein HDZ31DRAFT_38517 [Schizophyllum fasciatum]